MQTTDNNSWLIRANLWAKDPFLAPEDKKTLENLLNDKKPSTFKTLEEMFFQELEFGTAGLRGIVGLGSNRMNIYNIRKATHALALNIKDKFPADKILKVVISYDSRLTSEEFSLATAQIFCAHGIETFLMNRPTATPILSFAVRELSCHAGVMITASHNPKNYNGYKAYWNDGAQITSPIDKNIMHSYQKIQHLAEIPNFDSKKHKSWKQVPEELYQKYYQLIEASCLRPELCNSKGNQLKIVYTPLHGTGAEPVMKVLHQLGFSDLHLVATQAKPDGHFPTTDYPNPEDPKALSLANELLLKIQADVAIGSDPDTDRMGVILKTKSGSEFLSGNDIANLLLHYKLETLAEKNKLSENSLVLKSIVTSTLQDAMCAKHKVTLINTLTGFKWMAEVLRIYEEQSKKFDFVFASEESFGSMPNCFVRDKDGVAAAALLCEALLYYKTKNKNYEDIKQELHQKYGHFYDLVLNFQFPGIDGLQQMKLLMERLKLAQVPVSFSLPLTHIEDYQSGKSINIKTQEVSALTLPKTSMLGLLFQNNCRIYVRPSGTEPKIKFYLLLQGKNPEALKILSQEIQTWINQQIQNLKVKS